MPRQDQDNMNIITKLKTCWIWIDGNKTNIGAALLVTAAIIGFINTQILIKTWQLNIDWIPKIGDTFEELGNLFAFIGLGHKGIKGLYAKKNDGNGSEFPGGNGNGVIQPS